MNKSGLSNVIVVVLLTLLTISAIAILWVAVTTLISNQDISVKNITDTFQGRVRANYINVILNISRTNCVAPCSVFFDAINTENLKNNDFVNAYFSWDFGDGAKASGFLTGHVFNDAGTYNVKVSVDDGVNQGDTSVSVKVDAEPSGGWTTYCVSASGNYNECPNSNSNFHLTTFSEGMSKLGTSVRVLFHRGEVFQREQSFTSLANIQGPWLIGAYGTGNAPIINVPYEISTSYMFLCRQCTDGRIQDLHFIGPGQNSNAGGVKSSNGKDILVQRVELEQFRGIAVSPGQKNEVENSISEGFFVVDSKIHDTSSYGMFGNGLRFAFINNSITNLIGNEHGVRMQGGNRQYVNGNIVFPQQSKSAIQVRGDNYYSIVSDNIYYLDGGVHPQNEDQAEWEQYSLWERNLRIIHPTLETTTASRGVVVEARDVVVRNNIFYNIIRAVDIGGNKYYGTSERIYIYGNTHYNPSGNAFIVRGGASQYQNVQNLVVKNNIVFGGSGSLISAITSQPDVSNNLAYFANQQNCIDPQEGNSCLDPLFVSTDVNNEDFIKLQSASPAVDKGISYMGFFEDYARNIRPMGNAVDIGAYESF